MRLLLVALDFDPFIPDANTQHIVMEGFHQPDAIKSPAFEPLTELIEQYANGKFEAMPVHLRERVAQAFFPMPHWDQLAPDQRRSLAQQNDAQHDPALEPENEYWWQLTCRTQEVETEIKRWELMNDRALPSEAALKETQLALLKRRLDNLQKLLKLPPFTVKSWDGLTDEVLAAAIAPATPRTPAASIANSEAKDWATRAAREAMNPVDKLKSQLMVSNIAEVQHQLELAKHYSVLDQYRLSPDTLRMVEEQRSLKALAGGTSIADAVRQIGESQLANAAGLSASTSAADAYKQLGSADSLAAVAKQFLELENAAEQVRRAAGYTEPREIEVPLMPLYDPMEADRHHRARKREEEIETARLAEIARLQARDEYEAAKLKAATEAESVARNDLPTPVQRTAAQDAAILSTLAALNINPLAIPKNKTGKAGSKAKVRTALERNPLFVGATVFNKAWERLSARGDIVIRT